MDTSKRVALIESVVGIVAKHGFHGASVHRIAGSADVAAGTLYVHFESKENLMLETYRELEQRCLDAVLKEYPPQGSMQQRFSHLAHGLIRHFMLFPAEFLFVDQFLTSPYRELLLPNDRSHFGISGILQFFREGTEKQLFKEMPPAMLLALACGPLIQVLRAHAAGFLYLNDDRISRTAEACWETVHFQKVTVLEHERLSSVVQRTVASVHPETRDGHDV